MKAINQSRGVIYSAKTEVIGFLWASTLARYSVAYSRTGHLTSEKAYMEDKLKIIKMILLKDRILPYYNFLSLYRQVWISIRVRILGIKVLFNLPFNVE